MTPSRDVQLSYVSLLRIARALKTTPAKLLAEVT
jgi:hypothetical protein